MVAMTVSYTSELPPKPTDNKGAETLASEVGKRFIYLHIKKKIIQLN